MSRGVGAATSDRVRAVGEDRLQALGTFICANGRPLRAAVTLFRRGEDAVESKVAGSSMGESIPNGARIRIDRGAKAVEVGTVIAFVAGGKTFVHRVRWRGRVSGARDWLITQGDALLLPDLPVPLHAVLGRVAAMQCGAGWQRLGAKTVLPRRERALSWLVFAANVVLLEIHPRLASWLLGKLRAAEYRSAWTHTLLYGRPRTVEPAPQAPRVSRLVVGLAVATSRAQAWFVQATQRKFGRLARLGESAQRMFGAVCAEALNGAEKSHLTIRIYDFFPGYYRTMTDQLHPWEEPWFSGRLPPPPARVLVGASGVGREAIVLARRGFRVDAFDPAPDFAAASARALGEGARVFELSYEDLSAIMLEGRQVAGSELAAARYDAVVLGSGSLTHVLDPREQERLLRSSALLCPRGPILASFFGTAEDPPPPQRTGHAVRLGRHLGRMIAALRRMPPAGSDRLSYRPHSGFAYAYTRQEIERLAAAIGRETTWEPAIDGGFQCVTFRARPQH